ncbi:MAG: hypothetical protein PHU34_11875, partial [Candidatus Methanoperedens sp.]|nr:hypothetical protein [Candidatus Methanoperedens sp.]
MKITVQKTLTGEALDHISRVDSISLSDIVPLSVKYLISKANLRRLLFLLSFLTYGIGDGITAAYMMDKTGVMREINPIARFMYASSGAHGVIITKTWFALLILFLVWVIS